MGAKGKARFMESNVSICPTIFMNDFGAKGMGA
jgi:hypothetical protein